ncbi:hypothetical protein NDU88_002148 [Pleurodeles waltl]|uniref:Uncharacterized protein n=1 Tax=Pleurodeles waltl TaxID=8319 RepID=A0AAV7T1D8_PLEWA|nr:hypothetical protein NDU88_002148 [Pleurodeles waltl]
MSRASWAGTPAAYRVGHGFGERLPVWKHGRCIRVLPYLASTWELKQSSGERCAAPRCDRRGADGEALPVLGGPLGVPGAVADAACHAGASEDWCGPNERRSVLPCMRLKRHWECGPDRIPI